MMLFYRSDVARLYEARSPKINDRILLAHLRRRSGNPKYELPYYHTPKHLMLAFCMLDDAVQEVEKLKPAASDETLQSTSSSSSSSSFTPLPVIAVIVEQEDWTAKKKKLLKTGGLLDSTKKLARGEPTTKLRDSGFEDKTEITK